MANEYRYKIRPKETIWSLAFRFYGTTNEKVVNFLLKRNNITDPKTIKIDTELIFPKYIPYPGDVYEQNAGKSLNVLYEKKKVHYGVILDVKEKVHFNRVEVRYTSDFKNGAIAARRFIYCWEKRLPDKLYTINVFSTQDISLIEKYYKKVSPTLGFYYYELSGFVNNPDDKKNLFSILKKAKYDIWHSHGLLMVDDWGQPWYIGDYINECKKIKLFGLLLPRSISHSSATGFSSSWVDELYYTLNKNSELEKLSGKKMQFRPDVEPGNFNFYTPKEIEEIIIDDMFELYATRIIDQYSLDFRMYLKKNTEYAFMFAPPDCILGRDDVPHLDEISLNPYKNPVFFRSQENYNIEKLANEGKVTIIKVGKETESDFARDIYKIELKPNFLEYISLLNKYTWDLAKAINMVSEVNLNLESLDSSMVQAKYLLFLMRSYHKHEGADAGTWEKNCEEYMKKIESLSEKIKEKKYKETYMKSRVKADTGNWYGYFSKTGLPDKYESYINDLNKKIPCKFESPGDIIKKIFTILNNNDFKKLFSNYIDEIKRNVGIMNRNYFSFKHPIITVAGIIAKAFETIAYIPDESKIEEIYNEYVKEFEDAIAYAFVQRVSGGNAEYKQLAIDIINDLDTVFNQSTRTDLIRELNKFRIQPVQASNNPLVKIWGFITSPYVTGFWNNMDGADSLITKVIKVFSRCRNKLIIDAIRRSTNVSYIPVVVRQIVIHTELFTQSYKGMLIRTHGVMKLNVVRRYCVVSISKGKLQKLEHYLSGEAIKNKARAPACISNILSGIQLAASICGIFHYINTDDKDVDALLDFISSIASGGLALTGFTLGEFQILSKLINPSLIKIAGHGLQFVDSTVTLIKTTMDFYGDVVKNETSFAILDGIKMGISFLCAAFWGTVFVANLIFFIKTGAVLISAMNPWILLAMIAITIIFIIFDIIRKGMITGIEKVINDIILGTTNFYEGLEKAGFQFEHEADRYNLASRWFVNKEDTIEGWNYVNVFITHTFRQSEIAAIKPFIKELRDFSWKSNKNTRHLRFMPLDPEYCVPALIFCGWSEENILQITKDGWFNYTDDSIVEKEVKRYYRIWNSIYNSNDDYYINLVRDTRTMLDTGEKKIRDIYRKYSDIFRSFQ
ncbi:MAG: LysM peptidoglycan-binding domain-containing protein [Spirochaetales bacterium]|nr:LysM peptidoglycan-binding domain-containing protein [Spirochaetales bacterium]